MPGTEGSDYQAVDPPSQLGQQHAVVSEGDGDQRDPWRRSRALGSRDAGSEAKAAQQHRLAFDEVAQRAAVRGLERGGAGGVGIADSARGVDLVGEHDQHALAAEVLGGGDLDGGEEVRRTVGAGLGGAAHGASHHDRLGRSVGEVEHIGGLLDGVGAPCTTSAPSAPSARPSRAAADRAAPSGKPRDVPGSRRKSTTSIPIPVRSRPGTRPAAAAPTAMD